MLNPDTKYYQQVQSLRDVTGTNFANGQIRFNWSVPPEESWNPYLSYWRLRTEWEGYARKYGQTGSLTIKEPTIKVIDGIAPAMFFNDQFWQQLEMRINGVAVNQQDNYCGQIAALRHRMRPEEYNRTYGNINFHEVDFNKRASRLVLAGFQCKPCESGWIDFTYYMDPEVVDQTEEKNGNFTILGDGNILATLLLTEQKHEWDDLGWTIGEEGMLRIPFNNASETFQLIKFTVDDIDNVNSTMDIEMDSKDPLENVTNILADSPSGNIFFPGVLYKKAKCESIYDSLPVKQLETIWRPQMGFWQINDWLPGGEYEIVLTPFPAPAYKLNIIESKDDNVADIDFEVLTFELNICKSKKSSAKSMIQLEEIRVQAKTINTSSLTQKEFQINPKAKALTLAYQDNRVNSRFDISQSKFIIKDDSGGGINLHWEHFLSRFYIQYDGMVLPNPIPDIRRVDATDFIAQQYWETMHNKMIMHNEIEDFCQWKERGMYFHFNWPRQSETATQVQISQEFSSQIPRTAQGEIRPQILLFEHCIKEFNFELYHNYITKVMRKY